MECIILAGGLGTRLSHIIPNLPKPMAPIANRPFLEIILENLAGKGFKKAILSLGYKADIITKHFGLEYKGLSLVYAIEEQPLGTGGAVALAMKQSTHDHTYIFNGDTYLDLEIEDVEAMWQKHREPIIVGCMVPDASRYGRLQTINNRITGFTEKGIAGPGLINAGCYVFNAKQLDSFNPDISFSLETEYLISAVVKHQFDLFTTKGMFIDIGVPEDYYRAQTEILFSSRSAHKKFL